MRPRIFAGALALALPATASANHLHSGRPDCKTKVPAARGTTSQAADVSVHGFGGFTIDGTSFPAVAGVTPTPRYDKSWDNQTILYEGDVVGALISVNMIGVLGGGNTTIRPPGSAPTTYSGAQRFDAATFTGHFKITKKTYECESLVKPHTIIKNLYYDIWLTGFLTPTANSALKTYGQATMIAVSPGDVASR